MVVKYCEQLFDGKTNAADSSKLFKKPGHVNTTEYGVDLIEHN